MPQIPGSAHPKPAARRIVQSAVFSVFAGWGTYVGILTTGYFLGLVPRYRAESTWFILAGLAFAATLWRALPRLARVDPQPAARMREFGLALGSLCVLLFVVYAGALSLGLLSDDFALLDRATRHDFFPRSQFVRPLPLIAWALLQQVAGGAWPLHAFNLLLHGVNAALVFALGRMLGLSKSGSAGAALLFACFPASVEAVAWASGVQDLLLTTCCLGFVLACARGDRPRAALAWSAVAMLGALGTKETAVVAPVLAVIVHVRSQRRWSVASVAVGAVAAGAYAALRLSLFHVDSGFPVAPSRYFVKGLLGGLFASLGAPFTGAELAALPGLGIGLAWLFVVLTLAAAWRARTDERLAAIVTRCGFWAVASVAPVWSMFFVSSSLQGSRYLYLAACGWCVLVAALLMEWPGAFRRAGVALTACLAVVWLLGVRSHVRDWQEAAAVRDRVLTDAVHRLDTTTCRVLGFEQLPDSVGGGYVFRNGFLEALAGRGPFRAKPTTGQVDEAGCTIRWDGAAFK
jgi:protein O-mannosyl-transferase